METVSLAKTELTGFHVPPSGGSLEIGNEGVVLVWVGVDLDVPPSGGSLEIGNLR